MAAIINREHKDRLFKAIFGSPENKSYALSLYNALNGTDYKDENDLQVYTIEDAVYMNMKNDCSFILDGDLNLYEHQSTYSPNMPLRGFFYFAKQYQKYVGAYNINLYSSTLKKIPTPKYVVFYNGDRNRPEREVMKLSDAFINKTDKDDDYVPSLEVKALALNINSGKNEQLKESCRALHDYSTFIAYVTMYKKDHELEIAIDMAVDRAIDENLLDGYFLRHKAEVKEMILAEYDEKATMEMLREEYREEGLAEGRAEGLAEGRAEGRKIGVEEGQELEKKETVIRALERGLDLDMIAAITNVSKEYILALQNEAKGH